MTRVASKGFNAGGACNPTLNDRKWPHRASLSTSRRGARLAHGTSYQIRQRLRAGLTSAWPARQWKARANCGMLITTPLTR